jgi:hypothetical protein
MIPSSEAFQRRAQIMMGRQAVDQSQLFYLFNLEEHIPTDHLLRCINPIVTRVLASHYVRLLRPRRERPCCRTAEQGEEVASFHSPILPCFRPKG